MKKTILAVHVLLVIGRTVSCAQTNKGPSVDASATRTNRLHASLAYRQAALGRMVTEADYVAERLKLPIKHPIQITDITRSYVSPLPFGFGGMFETKNFMFSFPHHDGRLCYIERLKIKNEDSILDLYGELARTPSLITTNEAYQLATQWLAEVSIDLGAVERKHKLNFYQWFFWNPPGTTNKTMLPIFEVKWGEGDVPPVKVTILGTTRELMNLRIEDSSFCRRPPLVITNASELNSIPDPPLKQLQRAPQLPETDSLSTNGSSARPPPFRREIKN